MIKLFFCLVKRRWYFLLIVFCPSREGVRLKIILFNINKSTLAWYLIWNINNLRNLLYIYSILKHQNFIHATELLAHLQYSLVIIKISLHQPGYFFLEKTCFKKPKIFFLFIFWKKSLVRTNIGNIYTDFIVYIKVINSRWKQQLYLVFIRWFLSGLRSPRK